MTKPKNYKSLKVAIRVFYGTFMKAKHGDEKRRDRNWRVRPNHPASIRSSEKVAQKMIRKFRAQEAEKAFQAKAEPVHTIASPPSKPAPKLSKIQKSVFRRIVKGFFGESVEVHQNFKNQIQKVLDEGRLMAL